MPAICHSRPLPFLLALLACLVSCSDRGSAPTEPAPGKTVYQVRGVVRGVNLPGGTLEVQHEEIPGYMAAMTMPFNLRRPSEAAKLQPGQAIAFDLVVTRNDSWITRIRPLENATLHLPPAENRPARPPGRRLQEGDPIPAFKLLTEAGAPLTEKDLTGRPVVLTFIFTRCPLPNFCPLMARNFAELQSTIRQAPELRDVRLVSLTLDPEFDTPPVLSQYAQQQGADPAVWTFATGEPEEIARLAGAFAVHREREGESLNHSLTTALIDRSGVVRKIWRGNFWKPAEVVQALQQENSRLAAKP